MKAGNQVSVSAHIAMRMQCRSDDENLVEMKTPFSTVVVVMI
jgi:hypothetical protein